MSYAIVIGTTRAEWIDNKPTPNGCVRYEGDLPQFPIWDAVLNNIRARTQAELDALPAELVAAAAANEPQLDLLRQQAANATSTNDAFLAIGSPSNAQTLAQVRALTNQNNRIIAVLLRLINREFGA